MEFCLIAPTPIQQQFRRPREFCLAQRLASDTEYYEHYRQRIADGAHVIVDNGAYEGELVSFNTLIGLCVDLKPSVVIAPDFLGHPKQSRYVANEFLNLTRIHRPDYQTTMEVIHSTGDPWEYLQLYKSSKADWIGVPKRLENRVELFHNLKRAGAVIDKPHHALGLNYMNELEALAALRIFTSCDSEKPSRSVWIRAWLEDIDKLCRKYA